MEPAKKDGSFKHESHQDPESIQDYLEALRRGLDSGRLLFCSGKEELLFYPKGMLKLRVRARRKEGKARVELEISWREASEEQRRQPPLEIRVGDEERHSSAGESGES